MMGLDLLGDWRTFKVEGLQESLSGIYLTAALESLVVRKVVHAQSFELKD